MIDLSHESPIRLTEAARIIGTGRRGRPTNVSTILRWILTGQRGPDGQRIRLEGIRIGGAWRTTREAIQRYAERLTPNLSTDPAPTPRTAHQRQRAADRAARELERLGI